jgi:hypothetical protein
MPQKLKLPERYVPSLVDFLRLTPEQLALFLKTIREEEPDLEVSKLAEAIAERLTISRSRVDKLISLLTSLQRVRENLGLSVEDFVGELRAAIEATAKDDIQPPDWPTFQKAIAEALSPETALAISSKAVDVMLDHARYYCSARVLTDLRPVFKSGTEKEPPTFVTIHTLKIVYHEGDEHLEFFVALDRADVKRLSNVLERALRKEESLKALTAEKGIKILEVNS